MMYISQIKKLNAPARYMIVMVLSIMHVCFSAYTPSVAINPLTLLMLITSPICSEGLIYFLGGQTIQSIVTYLIASSIMGWKNRFVWFMEIMICLCAGSYSRIVFLESQMINTEWITYFEHMIGMYCYVDYVVYFAIGQIMLLILYPLLSWMQIKVKSFVG